MYSGEVDLASFLPVGAGSEPLDDAPVPGPETAEPAAGGDAAPADEPGEEAVAGAAEGDRASV